MSTRIARAAPVVAAVLVAASAVVGFGAAATSASLDASPDDPGATATHTATVTVTGNAVGSSWTGFQVEYQATDVSNVGQNDIVKIGIDRDDDDAGTTIDHDVSNDLSSVSASNNGETLTIGLDGSSGIQDGDELVVVFENAQNPDSAGDYSVGLHVNPQSADETATATLSIVSDTTTTATTTQTATQTTQTTTQTATATTQTTASDTTSSGGSDTTTDGSDTTTDSSDSTTTSTTTTADSNESEGNDSVGSTGVPSVEPMPEEPNVTATHAVTVPVDNETAGDSWNGLLVDYEGTGTDLGGVGQGDVAKIGIDRGSNDTGTTIDVNVSDDLSSVDVSSDARTLTVGLGGNYDLRAGDEVVVVYEGVQNPSEGVYRLSVDLNHQSTGGQMTAPFVLLTENTGTTASGTTQATDGNTAAATEDTDAAETTGESTPGQAPGFGVAASLVALAAAAGLLARR